jgi:transcriptional regulator with GAF, ATPase, and Fis domain
MPQRTARWGTARWGEHCRTPRELPTRGSGVRHRTSARRTVSLVPTDPEDAIVHVAELFGAIARTLADDDDVQMTLDKIVHLAVENLDACEFAGISLVEGRKITSPASSNDVPKILDAIQSEVDEGPCIDAIKEHEVFQTGDLAAEHRWPQFSTRANAETGVTSILSLRLFIKDDTMGSLNLYSTRPDAFDDTDVALGAVFAAHAAVAMSSAQHNRDLERKAASRDLIGRAKGILMARQHITDEEAFDMLRRASQRLNIKLTEVAQRLASSTETSADSAPNGNGQRTTSQRPTSP